MFLNLNPTAAGGPGSRSSRQAFSPPVAPPAADEASTEAGTETAILAGGCFWGVQGVYQHVQGVTINDLPKVEALKRL